ncbi:MAG: 2-C-methyl-D-erythritol 2,4-cyclodiphosphate synthase [Planctomycetota bacterium]|jgi:2-C-methyl-D-erythritol 2,4-cyclodiphosphate synthase
MRVGHGYDAHRYIGGRPLILGGVEIPYEKGLEAHSDGDAVIHALCDSLLGAAGLGDIGNYFPDTDKKFKNIDSRVLLREVVKHLKDKRYEIGNVDVTILAQAPKLSAHIPKMKYVLAEDLHTDVQAVNIKATTTEKMGFIGRLEGIAVHAVCLLNDLNS